VRFRLPPGSLKHPPYLVLPLATKKFLPYDGQNPQYERNRLAKAYMPGQAKVLSPQDIQSIFRLLESNRDRTIFALGVYTGMRISEIMSLRQDQVFTESGVKYQITVCRLKKKNTVYNDIPINPKLRQVLIDYRKELELSEWLFPSNESTTGYLSRKRAHVILSNAFKLLKLDGAKTHSMRRTLLTTLSRSGVPLRTVQEISGHSSLSELQAYLEVDPEDKHRAVNLVRY
jgi:integrase/recombinase XerD